MTRPTKAVVDCSTNTVEEIELNDEEMAQLEIDRADNLARREAEEVEATRVATLKTSAKAKLVAGEPLTEEEAAVIVL
jgi:hypothetical protein